MTCGWEQQTMFTWNGAFILFLAVFVGALWVYGLVHLTAWIGLPFPNWVRVVVFIGVAGVTTLLFTTATSGDQDENDN